MDAPAQVDADIVEEHRRLISAAAATLRERGRPVTTYALQTEIRQQLGVALAYREIIEARRPR